MSSLSSTGFGGLSNQAYGGSAGANWRRQEEAYSRGLRQLRRASRRGDTGAALQEIALRDKANAAGFAPGGIRDRAQTQTDLKSRLDKQKQAAEDRDQAANNERKMAGLIGRELDAAEDAVNPPVDGALDERVSEFPATRSDPFGLGGKRRDTRGPGSDPFGTPGEPLASRGLGPATQGAGYGTPLKDSKTTMASNSRLQQRRRLGIANLRSA